MQNEHIPSKNNFYFQVRSDIYHNNSTLLTLISSHQNTIIKNICLQLLTYSEQHDPILFLRTTSQLKSIHYISIKHHQIIASAILNLLFKQKDNNPTLELFHVLFNHIKYLSRFSGDSFTINWKLFYYYYLFYKKQFDENLKYYKKLVEGVKETELTWDKVYACEDNVYVTKGEL